MAERILVTGAMGFIGTHLVKRLLASRPGAKIVGTTRGNDPAHNLTAMRKLISICAFDLRRRAAVERLVADVRPDYVFHLGAQSLPPRSWDDPRYTLETNVQIKYRVPSETTIDDMLHCARLHPQP